MFFVLKIASTTNPIAAAIFKLFEFAGSSILFLVKSITPKSFNISNPHPIPWLSILCSNPLGPVIEMIVTI